MVKNLASINFGGPRLGHTIKANRKKLQTFDAVILNFNFLGKGLGLDSLSHFVCDF